MHSIFAKYFIIKFGHLSQQKKRKLQLIILTNHLLVECTLWLSCCFFTLVIWSTINVSLINHGVDEWLVKWEYFEEHLVFFLAFPSFKNLHTTFEKEKAYGLFSWTFKCSEWRYRSGKVVTIFMTLSGKLLQCFW